MKKKTEVDFFLHMTGYSCHITSKEVEKARNCSFNVCTRTLLHIDTNVLTIHVGKMVDDMQSIVSDNIAIPAHK